MKTKLTRMETRAQAWCERVKESDIGEPATFAIEWRRSRTWGRIAVIETCDGKAAEASGCGYNKESAALAQFLQFLGETEADRNAIARTAGAGFNSVAGELAKYGWRLNQCQSITNGILFYSIAKSQA